MKIYCGVCKVELTPENRPKTTNWLCKEHNNARRKKYGYKKYSISEAGKKAINNASKTAYKRYPEKWIARAKLRYAVKKGGVIKPPFCEQESITGLNCEGKIQAHHYLGYEGEHWKDVLWLCPRHHAKEHLRLKRLSPQEGE